MTGLGIVKGADTYYLDKVLTAYPISQLDPTNPSNIVSNHRKDKSVLASRVLSNHACYFNTGTCHGRTLVVTMKRRGHDSHFKAFEPVCGDLSNPKNSKYISTKTSFMSKQHAWFKLYQVREFVRCIHYPCTNDMYNRDSI